MCNTKNYIYQTNLTVDLWNFSGFRSCAYCDRVVPLASSVLLDSGVRVLLGSAF